MTLRVSRPMPMAPTRQRRRSAATPASRSPIPTPYTFGLANETDECIDVEDTLGGVLGTVCADDPPADFTFEYSYDVGPAECGETDVPNTASFETNDNAETGSDNWNVHIIVDCDQGCTLTQGYWKTHSEFGPAPEDETWLLLPDVDGDTILEGPNETFFLSGKTWYEVFWTKPAGNAYYTLAKQYMAAVLNVLNGASTTPAVDTALASAKTLFETYTPAQIARPQGQQAAATAVHLPRRDARVLQRGSDRPRPLRRGQPVQHRCVTGASRPG